MSELQKLNQKIETLRNSSTCPTIEEQTLLIHDIHSYVKEQQALIKNTNDLIQDLDGALNKINVFHDLFGKIEILQYKINNVDNMEDIFEMLFQTELTDFLFSISKCSWEFYNQPFYKRSFRFQQFRKFKEFEKHEYQILLNIWKQA